MKKVKDIGAVIALLAATADMDFETAEIALVDALAMLRTAGPTRRGQRTRETIDGIVRGNQALSELREQFFADLGITRAADEIAAEGRRYETTRWRTDRQRAVAEIPDARQRLFAKVLQGRRHFPGSRRVRGVLSEKFGK